MTERTDPKAESSAPVDRRERLGAAAIACVTLGLLTFPIAFNLGAYDQVLYPDVFRIIVASFVLLCVSFIAPTYFGRRLGFTRVMLASPALWVAVSVIVLGSTAEATRRPFFIAWLTAIMLVSVPVTLMMLLDLFNPNITTSRNRQISLWVTSVVIMVAVAGYLAGANNERLMTCADFAIAGSAEPDGCAH
jgi:hypothetical protein